MSWGDFAKLGRWGLSAGRLDLRTAVGEGASGARMEQVGDLSGNVRQVPALTV